MSSLPLADIKKLKISDYDSRHPLDEIYRILKVEMKPFKPYRLLIEPAIKTVYMTFERSFCAMSVVESMSEHLRKRLGQRLLLEYDEKVEAGESGSRSVVKKVKKKSRFNSIDEPRHESTGTLAMAHDISVVSSAKGPLCGLVPQPVRMQSVPENVIQVATVDLTRPPPTVATIHSPTLPATLAMPILPSVPTPHPALAMPTNLPNKPTTSSGPVFHIGTVDLTKPPPSVDIKDSIPVQSPKTGVQWSTVDLARPPPSVETSISQPSETLLTPPPEPPTFKKPLLPEPPTDGPVFKKPKMSYKEFLEEEENWNQNPKYANRNLYFGNFRLDYAHVKEKITKFFERKGIDCEIIRIDKKGTAQSGFIRFDTIKIATEVKEKYHNSSIFQYNKIGFTYVGYGRQYSSSRIWLYEEDHLKWPMLFAEGRKVHDAVYFDYMDGSYSAIVNYNSMLIGVKAFEMFKTIAEKNPEMGLEVDYANGSEVYKPLFPPIVKDLSYTPKRRRLFENSRDPYERRERHYGDAKDSYESKRRDLDAKESFEPAKIFKETLSPMDSYMRDPSYEPTCPAFKSTHDDEFSTSSSSSNATREYAKALLSLGRPPSPAAPSVSSRLMIDLEEDEADQEE